MTKIGFGRLVNVLTIWGMRELEDHEMASLERLTAVEPECKPIDIDLLNSLLNNMALARHKKQLIPAIKDYRTLTNVGLKEAKEAVERYCGTEEGARLSDILGGREDD